MNPYHVKYFLDAVRFKSVAESARANHVTHPAVSQAIRVLEGELHVELLTHQKRRFQVTPEGQMFFERASEWVSLLDQVKQDILANSKELTGDLILGGPQSLTADFIGPAIFAMKRKYPKVKVHFSFGDASLIREKVRKGEINVGFLIDDNKLSEFQSECLSEGEFVVVAREASRKIWDKDILITDRNKVEVENLFSRLNDKFKKTPEICLELVSWSLIRRFVAEEDVHGYIPDYVVKDELRKGLLFKVDTGVKNPRYSVKAIWRKENRLSLAQKEFIRLLKKNEGGQIKDRDLIL